MTYNISTTQRLAPGETWTITDMIGVNIVAPATGQTVVSFNNAGTILINVNSPYISAGLNYDHGSIHDGSVFTNEATGVFRMVSTGGLNPTYGFTSGQSITGFTGDFVNHGVFEVSATAFAAGVQTLTSTFTLTNTGQFRIQGGTGAVGIIADYGITLDNTGLIEVSGPAAVGVSSGGRADITNSGTIRAIAAGPDGWSIGISVSHSELEVSHITNTGRIEAQCAILDETNWSPPQTARQIVTNSGQIIGLIDLARGDDQLINSGSIEGEIWLGYGADIYDGRGGSHTGALHGGFGDDVLTGGDGIDILFGEDGDDTIRSGGGDDVIQGGRGINTIDAGAGIDTLTYGGLTMGVDLDLATGVATAAGRDQISGVENVLGSHWADRLLGDAGGNSLYGDDGDDTLHGRDGADELAGGRGADRLTGGDGADTFRFGAGDGADVISDLSDADSLIVHGYATWREIVQVGTDVRITLSDTDSILLQNTTVSSVSARTTFTASARPTYGIAGDAPEMLGETHVEIRNRFTILEGETVAFDGAVGGLAVYGILEPDAGVTNGGLVISTGTTSTGANGVGLSGFNFGGDFDNLATGVLRVVTTHASATATGVIGKVMSVITNHGLIDVQSAYAATGILGANISMTVINTGVVRVESAGRAWGANLGAMGELVNDGLIEVTGSGEVLGIRSYVQTNINNTGTLRVENRTGDSTGILIRSDVVDIFNSGLIEADLAIDVQAYGLEMLHSVLDNAGEIRGDVSLSGGADRVVNSGRIDGEIRLNGGADTYDGSEGLQTGAVLGGSGRDHLIGSRHADSFAGGEHSDTLFGGGGDDLLDGGEGDDFVVLTGPRSAYSWTVDGNTVTITGPDGTDVLKNVELLRFSDQLVSLTGFGIRERGGSGDDMLSGSELNDVLDGGPVPYLFEMQGSTDNGVDRLFGLAGDDTLTGGGRNDHLDGGTGADQLDGGLDDDALYGGSGNDRLTGGRGSDRIDGGAGVDVAVFAGARADYTIETANGVTTITTVDWVNPYNPQIVRMAHDRLTGVERLQFSDQVVILRADPTEGTSGDDLMSGGAGDDALSGGLGADHLGGGAGDDELNGGLGNDVMDGGDGYDTVVVEGSAEDYRLLVDGDGFILKGADGGDRLIGIEMIRFSEGGEWDLARMYDGDEPQVMPMPGDFLVKDGSPEILPPLPGGSDGDLPMTLPPAADVLPAAAPGPPWRFALQDDGWSLSGGLGPDAEPARHWNWF